MTRTRFFFLTRTRGLGLGLGFLGYDSDSGFDTWTRTQHWKTYWINWNLLDIKDDILVRRWESDDGKEKSLKIVLPERLRPTVLAELHNTKTASHLGVNKMLHKVQYRFYWIGLAADVRSWVRKCTVCAQAKHPPKRMRAPLQRYQVGAPLERVGMDVLGPLPETDRGNKYILVVGDYFKMGRGLCNPKSRSCNCC